MALSQEQANAIQARLDKGERLRSIFKDLKISDEDRKAFRLGNKVAVRKARQARKLLKGLAKMSVDAVDAEIATLTKVKVRLNKRRKRVLDRIKALETERESR